jgi:hypothetical protein
VPAVEIRLAEPLPTTTAVGTLESWTELLSELREHRAQASANADEYVLGLFRAAESFAEFCMGGCITGLSHVASSPGDSLSRTSLAIGYSGPISADTAAHEVGHAHGRQHAPCDNPSAVDPAYPHPMGAIGTWGYDLTTGSLKSPTTPDFMSYCDPSWVSDYTFEGLFARGQLVNVAAKAIAGPSRRYDQILVGPDGSAHLRPPLGLREPLAGFPLVVRLDDDQSAQGHYYPYDHLPGGLVLVPASDARRLRFAVGGREHDLRR